METFGWCFIGTGKLAGQVAQQLAGTRHKIVSCYTRNFENAKAFAESVGAEAYAEDAVIADGHRLTPIVKYYRVPDAVMKASRQTVIFE